MHENFKAFDKKFNVNNNLITTTSKWRLSLRPNQPTLGSCILSLGRYCEQFSDITKSESSDLKEMISYTETHLKKAFSYNRINYLMLMMVDPHLHFHVIPRYEEAQLFEGTMWKDENWPTPPDLGGRAISDKEAKSIIQAIKAN